MKLATYNLWSSPAGMPQRFEQLVTAINHCSADILCLQEVSDTETLDAITKTGGYLVNGKPRRLHPRECARIMGYPDSYKMAKSANQAYKQFGNSVVIDVLQYIAQEIGRTVKEAK